MPADRKISTFDAKRPTTCCKYTLFIFFIFLRISYVIIYTGSGRGGLYCYWQPSDLVHIGWSIIQRLFDIKCRINFINLFNL